MSDVKSTILQLGEDLEQAERTALEILSQLSADDPAIEHI